MLGLRWYDVTQLLREGEILNRISAYLGQRCRCILVNWDCLGKNQPAVRCSADGVDICGRMSNQRSPHMAEFEGQ